MTFVFLVIFEIVFLVLISSSTLIATKYLPEGFLEKVKELIFVALLRSR